MNYPISILIPVGLLLFGLGLIMWYMVETADTVTEEEEEEEKDEDNFR